MNSPDYFAKVDRTAEWLEKKIPFAPKLLVVLSGGLGEFAAGLEKRSELAVADIPGFPVSRAEGHAGKLAFGVWAGVPLVAMLGRQHYYEGHAPPDIVFPYFVLNKIGAATLITTNAVGGIRHDLDPGDIVVVTDHINLMGTNPLIGIALQRKTDQFTSLIRAYDSGLRDVARRTATAQGVTLKEGVYIACTGPSYETPAEIKAFRSWGADTVGMSTVFEVIAANFLGMKVLTFNIITNAAADRFVGDIHHSHVLEAMKQVSTKMVALLRGVVEGLA